MTNLEAIKIVSSQSDPESKVSAIASVFLKEDIIENDVNDWIKMPMHRLLAQFSALSEDSASSYIESVIESEGEFLSEEHLMDLSERYQDVIQTMIEYIRIRSIIIERSER
ncbi:MAG: hypothetical protein CMJ25_23820 [Phycisphaerae bacterium]|nr:hypothetical protein [Phycisphaerae bacterium]|tara:strand:+ start:87 stop:419 length:333 start_codon:yes stop_codon:yes gene_type:complete